MRLSESEYEALIAKRTGIMSGLNRQAGLCVGAKQIKALAEETVALRYKPQSLVGPKAVEPKRSKYGNKKIVLDGITFDSIKEAGRYAKLVSLQDAGVISELQLQREFILVESVVLNGRKKPPVKYKADFVYVNSDSVMIVEDVKSAATRKLPVFRLKAHLMKHVWGLDISEV